MLLSDTAILDYRADTLGIISALLHGYSGGITIVREMAQNADDVEGDDPRWLEFHFDANALRDHKLINSAVAWHYRA